MSNVYIPSERQRNLPSVKHVDGQLLAPQNGLPLGAVIKSIVLRFSGNTVVTYASGTPLASAQSTLHDLISYFEVSVDGGKAIKKQRAHFLHMNQFFAKGVFGTRRAEAGASAAPGNNARVDGGFVYPTSTQLATVTETVTIFFEHIHAKIGQQSTWLDTRGRSSAELKFQASPYAKALLAPGNTAPVVFSSDSFTWDISIVEMRDVPADAKFGIWRQTTKDVPFAGQQSNVLTPINRGKKLSGLMFFAQDGAAGSAATATGKLATDLLVSDMALYVNGDTPVKATTWLKLQDENRARLGLNAPYSSNVSRLTGVTFWDFLADKDLSSAMDTSRKNNVDAIDLAITTNSSSLVDYTGSANLAVETHEVIPYGGDL